MEATTKKNSRRKSKQKFPMKSQVPESDRFNSLQWNQTLSNYDSFAFLSGGVEGGFLSLEEIDESEFGIRGGISELEYGNKKNKTSSSSNSKKRKWGSGCSDEEMDEGGSFIIQEQDVGEQKAGMMQKKGKKIRKKANKKMRLNADKEKHGEVAEASAEVSLMAEDSKASVEADVDEESHHDDEFFAWNELRLHPLLIKSIRMLGFRQPTPIQKACIPVAAHQGKDVIGAAQTGSGKTLAFGLPILQRLLEEREKDGRLNQNDTEVPDKGYRGSNLRALILAPTRELALQVSDHLKKVGREINVGVLPIVGGVYSEKQERLLKRRPEIVVGTPGRLWELMSGGNEHLVKLHSLSFFVLDEADRMIENGHFNELQSIIDRLPAVNGTLEQTSEVKIAGKTIPNFQQKKRQTFVFSATVALSENFRKKLKYTTTTAKANMPDALTSIEKLSEQAGMKPDVAVIDLTNAFIVADNLVESFLKCSEDDKEAYLYYILSVHRRGRTIVFCTSIAALRRVSSLLKLLEVNAWTLHAQMQQRSRLKAMDRFRESEHGVLIATDVAARGLDIPGIRTVIHYQLPHSTEVYIHRSGRTARACTDGCSITLISPSDQAKFSSLCRSLSKESLQEFHVDDSYLHGVIKRLSLARQIDKIKRKGSQENARKSWFERNAESVGLAIDDTNIEEEKVTDYKQRKISSLHLKNLQQELNTLLSRPLQPKAFSHRFLAGAGVSTLVQQQLEELVKAQLAGKMGVQEKRRQGLVVIGQDCVEPLQALRNSGREVCVNLDKKIEARRLVDKWKSKRKQEKKREREQKRKARKKAKEGII
ncbi:DEAD-box ATP-dependent RNA helicase 13 [Apostasia shenzhenica]|uniref:DEAD-box ATP-dependent RNA helicase 13 n=1 Tax=Apostasia shenzhenica TaxID=1088818 RepID=A0A2I0B4L7_9ASPA|nr:DEAD-box ATP-dependent RNA helicase 13 [Apostasia shenzhenica]